jgi:hypothetical protein
MKIQHNQMGNIGHVTLLRNKYIWIAVLRIRIWDPVQFWPLDPGSGIGFSWSRIPNSYFLTPGSGIQTHIFESFSDNFLGKSSIILWNLDQIFLFSRSKLKIIFKFCEICGYKKRYDNKFFHPSLLLWIPDPGSKIPGSRMGKNQDPG